MASPVAQAWQDALSGNMTFRGDRSKYYSAPPPAGQGDVMGFINKLVNESLLMPQTATAGWVNAFGAPPGVGALMPKPAAPAAPAAATPTGNLGLGPGGVGPAPRIANKMSMGPAGATSMSLPMAQAPDILTKILGIEGTGQNPRSSAIGPGQFTDGTFNEYLTSQGKALGQNGVPADIKEAKKLLGRDATEWYIGENKGKLGKMNLPVTDATLYGSHFLGAGGLQKVWSADPNTPVAQLLDANAISSNPEILAGKTAGEVKQWLEQKTSGNVLPTPPLAGAPPQMGAPSTLDFSQQNAFLDAAKPKGVDNEAYDALNRSNVLGGLAKGAASVKSTDAGSFAAALAAAGAGGQEGMSKATANRIDSQENVNKQDMAYNLTRASTAGQQMTAAHANEKEQLAVAFNNAKSVYDTTIANNQIKYEGDVKERTARMPQVKADANGFMIQQFNPNTNSMDIKYTPTKDIMGSAEKLESTLKGLNAPGPVAEALMSQHVMQTIKDPTIAQATLEREAVRRTIINGGGSTVFGKAYELALKQAESQIPAALMKEPAEYLRQQQEIAAASLYNALQKKGDRSWLKAAANNGSVIAGILSGGAGTQ